MQLTDKNPQTAFYEAFCGFFFVLFEKIELTQSQFGVNIPATQTHNHKDQNIKQFVYGGGRNFLVDLFTNDASEYTAEHHADHHDPEAGIYINIEGFRNAAVDKGNNQAGNLGDQNHVEGVLGCYLCRHGKEEVQHSQVHGAAADSYKGGKASKTKTKKNQRNRLAYMERSPFCFI